MHSLSLLQGIFPTQGSNPGLLYCRWILYQLSHKGSPRMRVGSLSLLQGISPTQESNWVLLHCRRILFQLSYQGSWPCAKLAFMGQREPGKWPKEERQRGKRKTRQGRWASAKSWQNSSTEEEYFYNLKCLKEAGGAQMFSLNLTMRRFCVLMKTVISTDFRNREPVWEVSWSWDTEVSE